MLTATKVKNRVVKMLPEASCTELHNVYVNQDLRGCSGFITLGSAVVYINTEPSVCGGTLLVRFARDTKDYCGEFNIHVAEEALPGIVVQMLKNRNSKNREENCVHTNT